MYIKFLVQSQTETHYNIQLLDCYIPYSYRNKEEQTSIFSQEKFDKMDKQLSIEKDEVGYFTDLQIPLTNNNVYWCDWSLHLNKDSRYEGIKVLSSKIKGLVYVDKYLKVLDNRASTVNVSIKDYPKEGYYIDDFYLGTDIVTYLKDSRMFENRLLQKCVSNFEKYYNYPNLVTSYKEFIECHKLEGAVFAYEDSLPSKQRGEKMFILSLSPSQKKIVDTFDLKTVTKIYQSEDFSEDLKSLMVELTTYQMKKVRFSYFNTPTGKSYYEDVITVDKVKKVVKKKITVLSSVFFNFDGCFSIHCSDKEDGWRLRIGKSQSKFSCYAGDRIETYIPYPIIKLTK